MSDHPPKAHDEDPCAPEPVPEAPDSVPRHGLDLWAHRMSLEEPDQTSAPSMMDPDDLYGLAAERAGVPSERLEVTLLALENAMLATHEGEAFDALTPDSPAVQKFLRDAATAIRDPNDAY